MRRLIEDIVDEHKKDVIVYVNNKRVFFPIAVDVEGKKVEAFSPVIPDYEASSSETVIQDIANGDADGMEPIDSKLITIEGEIKIVLVEANV